LGPYDPPWKQAKLAFTPASEAVLRDWLDRAPSGAALEHWRTLVRAHAHLFSAGGEPLLARRIVIGDRTAEQVVTAFASIATITGPVTLRQLSATVFWGDSKVLDDRADLVVALFPELELRERAIIVAVHLPANVNGVLFIENQDTYVAACDGVPSQLSDLALVYASGFRASATRIRLRSGARLHFGGVGSERYARDFEAWWFDQRQRLGPMWFWGDLDFAGMQILKSLRDRFGEVSAWRPGYEPMLHDLQLRGGYRPVRNEAGQRDPGATGCEYADSILLPAVRANGYRDQEGGNEALRALRVDG
jgi:hypothetical protein